VYYTKNVSVKSVGQWSEIDRQETESKR
jgi:hypothetical protein